MTDPIDLLFQLNVNEFQNVLSLQMIVQDIRVSPSYVDSYEAEKARYTEVYGGSRFDESEDILPSRDDFVIVYKLLRREFYNGHTVFPMRRLLGLLNRTGHAVINYAKLKFIIRIMQELRICDITEPAEDEYIFAFGFQAGKTNIEKSSILRKLKTQLNRP